MKNGLYHRDLPRGVPQSAVHSFLGVTLRPQYSRHAMQEAIKDRYANRAPWTAPQHLVLGLQDIVEAQVEDGVAVKVVVRFGLDAFRDLVLVLQQPDDFGRVFVRTLWLNDVDDKHSTLDKSKYANW